MESEKKGRGEPHMHNRATKGCLIVIKLYQQKNKKFWSFPTQWEDYTDNINTLSYFSFKL